MQRFEIRHTLQHIIEEELDRRFGQLSDDMVIADLDASLLADSTGRRWMRARRPQLYASLTVPTGLECDTRKLKFEE